MIKSCFLLTVVAGALCVTLAQTCADEPQAEELFDKLIQKQVASGQPIVSPTGVSVSPDGIVFVSCDPNGVTNRKRKVGKVVRCEDTDRDGVADRFTNFVEGIDSPRGSCFVNQTLYLLHSPFLAAYQDLDGDGVADKKKILVKNLGPNLSEGGVIHGPNGIQMGIDGWLYLAIGDQGCFHACGSDGKMITMRGGGILRVRPDGSQLEKLVTGTRNIYDIAIDPYLNLIGMDNSNDGGGWGTRLLHLVEGSDFGYPTLFWNFQHETMPPIVDSGPGVATSMCYVHEPGFPSMLGDGLYSGDLNQGLTLHQPKPLRSTYRVRRVGQVGYPKIVGMDVDGLSRIYCVSREGSGFGYSSRHSGHVDSFEPPNSTRSQLPAFSRANEKELLDLLKGNSQVLRINAMSEIVSRGSHPDFLNGLAKLAEDRKAPLYARVAGLLTLKQIAGTESHSRIQKLYEDENVREFVVRAVADVAQEFDKVSLAICTQALQDNNPRVQLRGVIGLARANMQKSTPAIFDLATSEKLLPESAALERSEPRSILPHVALKAVISLGDVDFLIRQLNHTTHETALRALQEIHSEKVIKGLAAKIRASQNKQLVKRITIALFRLYHREAAWDGKSWWKSRPNFAGPYFSHVKWDQTPAVKLAIESAFQKVSPQDYGFLFEQMRLNQVSKKELNLSIDFDEVLDLLNQPELTSESFSRIMKAAGDKERTEHDKLKIYRYFASREFPESYLHRVQILRAWDEGNATGVGQRKVYAEFVSGREFIGELEQLAPFLGQSENDCNKYAHIQLINLINSPRTPVETRQAALVELEKTWADRKNIYPHRLRGLMLAFSEVDPTPYADKLKPLVDHRDERTKQGAAKYLKAIADAKAKD